VYGASSVYGEDIPMSAMGVTMKINNILVGILNGIAAGCLPIVGFNYGAGKIDRVKKTLKLAVGAAMIAAAVATFCFQVFPTQIVGIFGSESELYTEFAVKTLRIFMMLCILDGLNNILPTFLQAVEKPKYSTISSSCRQIIFQVPAAFIAAAIFGVIGVLFCGPITCVASFILNLFLVRKSFKELDQIEK
jgi:Na+-driven multidrug efflux pump